MRPRTVDRAITHSVAMLAPAVRTVLIHVWCWEEDEGGTGTEILPVLGIIAKRRTHYYRQLTANGNYPAHASTRGGLLKLGWQEAADLGGLDGMEYDVLVVDTEFGEIVCGESVPSGNSVVRAVACPWPAGEDESRLAPIVEELAADAKSKVQFRQSLAEIRKETA